MISSSKQILVVALALRATWAGASPLHLVTVDGPALAEPGGGESGASPGPSASGALGSQPSAEDAHDVALHALHAKAVELQVGAADAFAASLVKQAAANQLDLTSFVDDARRLADADPPVAPEKAAELEKTHRETLRRVEGLLALPGLFGTLGAGGRPPFHPGSLAAPPAVAGCNCENLVFRAPHPGSNHQSFPLGGIAVSPAPVSELGAEFRSGAIAAGHQVASTGESFTAPAGVRSVVASATMGLHADVGVGGLGVAHGWSDAQLVVREAATGAEACRTRFETNNRATGAWYYRDIRDHGEQTLSCGFARDPAGATRYSVRIELRAYGTYAGLAGGHSVLRAKLQRIDVALCP
jgi:hypothetical protein